MFGGYKQIYRASLLRSLERHRPAAKFLGLVRVGALRSAHHVPATHPCGKVVGEHNGSQRCLSSVHVLAIVLESLLKDRDPFPDHGKKTRK